MKNNRKWFIVIVLQMMADLAPAQDPNYSQWLNAPLYYNPAYAGLSKGIRVRFSVRDQWPNLPVDFRTCYFSADLGDRNLPGAGGIGLLINRDNEGIGFIKNLSVTLAVAARIPIRSNLICQVAIKGGMVQKWLSWNDFVFSDQLSAKYGNIYTSAITPPETDQRLFPDFGAGGIIQFGIFDGILTGTAGISADHLFEPDESFISVIKSPLPRKYIGHFDCIITLGQSGLSEEPLPGFSDPFRINPGCIYQYQAGFSTFQAGLNMLKYNIYLGGYYKTTTESGTNHSLMLLTGYHYVLNNEISFRFMYSYDLQLSGNLQGTGGAHEISLILELKNIRLVNKNRYEECEIFDEPGRKAHYLECSPF